MFRAAAFAGKTGGQSFPERLNACNANRVAAAPHAQIRMKSAYGLLTEAAALVILGCGVFGIRRIETFGAPAAEK
jgi:hypothetical protein